MHQSDPPRQVLVIISEGSILFVFISSCVSCSFLPSSPWGIPVLHVQTVLTFPHDFPDSCELLRIPEHCCPVPSPDGFPKLITHTCFLSPSGQLLCRHLNSHIEISTTSVLFLVSNLITFYSINWTLDSFLKLVVCIYSKVLLKNICLRRL